MRATMRMAAEPVVQRTGAPVAATLGAIGDTPLGKVDNVWVKLDYLNPSGFIKARTAKYMIARAESEGLLRPGDTIAEASSGNTGNAMSVIAAVKGYRMLVVTNGVSPERPATSRAFGAQVMAIGDFHVTEALAKARRTRRIVHPDVRGGGPHLIEASAGGQRP